MRIVLGPVPCHDCRRLLFWDGWEWKNLDGTHPGSDHDCRTYPHAPGSNARAISTVPQYNEQTGTSGAHVDFRADAVPQLVPVGAASLRLRQVLDA